MIKLADVEGLEMKIVKAPPPNAVAIERVFPGVTSRPGVIFCYGRIIYNPSGVTIPLQLLAHEAVHSLQQEKSSVENWWTNYFYHESFRYDQELEAHRVEYECYRKFNNRSFSRQYLLAISERLAGPLYGSVCNTRRARTAILATGENHE